MKNQSDRGVCGAANVSESKNRLQEVPKQHLSHNQRKKRFTLRHLDLHRARRKIQNLGASIGFAQLGCPAKAAPASRGSKPRG